MIIQANFPKFLKKSSENYRRDLEKSIYKKLKLRFLEISCSRMSAILRRQNTRIFFELNGKASRIFVAEPVSDLRNIEITMR